MLPGRSRPDWSRRLGEAARLQHEHGLDAVVVSSPVNIRYLTGFSGSAGLLVLAPGEVRLLLDGRYEQPARAAAESGEIAEIAIVPAPGSYAEALGRMVAQAGWRRVGFEAGHVTVAMLLAWQREATGVEWVNTERLVERLRVVKDDFELATLVRAGRLIDSVAGALGALVREGLTEIEVARSVDRAIERVGFSAPAFPTIVASGPASAHPHARPGDRRLSAGDLVLLDFGGVLDGYCVDLTRMAAIGAVIPEAERLFTAVRDAQAAALAAVRPGVPASSVDEAARSVLTARGLEAAVLHAVGHGLGLDVHEAPRLGPRRAEDGDASDSLAVGMVCTVEPGAYLEGLGGVRIEDDVLVTSGGYEALTSSPRDLLVV